MVGISTSWLHRCDLIGSMSIVWCLYQNKVCWGGVGGWGGWGGVHMHTCSLQSMHTIFTHHTYSHNTCSHDIHTHTHTNKHIHKHTGLDPTVDLSFLGPSIKVQVEGKASNWINNIKITNATGSGGTWGWGCGWVGHMHSHMSGHPDELTCGYRHVNLVSQIRC